MPYIFNGGRLPAPLGVYLLPNLEYGQNRDTKMAKVQRSCKNAHNSCCILQII